MGSTRSLGSQPVDEQVDEPGALAHEHFLCGLGQRARKRDNDTSALMEDAERVDFGDVADPDAAVAFTVSMPNRVLNVAREIAAAEGASTSDVLRRFLEAGANALVESEA